jgi:magnesium-protoporphyrin IX monomethyl ester (oxidative) cyclase
MNIVLINPPYIFSKRSDIVFPQCLGLLYISASLIKDEHSVVVIDSLWEGRNNITALADGTVKVGLDNQEIIARLHENTELIGLSVPFSHFAPHAHVLVADLKRALPSIPVVMGGVYPSTQPGLAMTSEADYFILGEGEVSMSKLADCFTSKSFESLPAGVIAKCDVNASQKASPQYVRDVDGIPFPQRELLEFEKYVAISPRNQRGWRTASILSSRGCPYDCEFCSVHPVCGYKWRPRSAKNVLCEIESLIDQYKVNHFEIEDDNFSFNKERTIEILEGIIEINSRRKSEKIAWSTPNGIRIDTLDEKVMEVISRSNCLAISIALEHGDGDVLKIMRKKLSLEKVEKITNFAHKYNISTNIFIIYGYPGESRERFERALDFYSHLRNIAPKINFLFFLAQPYPGTKLYERCLKEGYIEEDFFNSIEKVSRFSTASTCWINTPDFDKEELLRREKELIKTLNPTKYFVNRFKGILPEQLIPYGRLLFHMGKKVLRSR